MIGFGYKILALYTYSLTCMRPAFSVLQLLSPGVMRHWISLDLDRIYKGNIFCSCFLLFRSVLFFRARGDRAAAQSGRNRFIPWMVPSNLRSFRICLCLLQRNSALREGASRVPSQAIPQSLVIFYFLPSTFSPPHLPTAAVQKSPTFFLSYSLTLLGLVLLGLTSPRCMSLALD